jgi:hypothetical protein
MRRSVAIVLASVITLIVVASIVLVSSTSSSHQLSTKLLRGRQVPPAWQSEDFGKAVSGLGCLSTVLNSTDLHPSAQANVLYVNDGSVPPEVGETVATYSDAAKVFQSVVGSLNHCKKFNGGNSGGAGVSGSLTTLNFPAVGSSSAAFVATISDEAVPVTLTQDIVVAVKGRYILEIFESNLGRVNVKQFEKFISSALADV